MADILQNGRYFAEWPIFCRMADILQGIANSLQNGRYFAKWPIFCRMADILQNGRYFAEWPIFCRMADIFTGIDNFLICLYQGILLHPTRQTCKLQRFWKVEYKSINNSIHGGRTPFGRKKHYCNEGITTYVSM